MRRVYVTSLISACLMACTLWAHAIPLQGGVQEFDPGPGPSFQGGATDTFDVETGGDPTEEQPVQGRRRGGIRFSPPRVSPNSRCGSDQENINRISARFGTGPVRVPAERVGWPGYHYAYCGIDYCNLNTKVLCWKKLDDGTPQEMTDGGSGEDVPNRPPINIGGRYYDPNDVIAQDGPPNTPYPPSNTSPLPPFPLSVEDWGGNPTDLGLPTPPLVVNIHEDAYPKPQSVPSFKPQTPKTDKTHTPKTPTLKPRIQKQGPPKHVGFKEGAGCLPERSGERDFFHVKLSNKHQAPGEVIGGHIYHPTNHFNFVWVDGRIWRDKVHGDRFEVLRAWRREPLLPKVQLYAPGTLVIKLYTSAQYAQKAKTLSENPCPTRY